jgi:sortase (surface protein transpeptidase)
VIRRVAALAAAGVLLVPAADAPPMTATASAAGRSVPHVVVSPGRGPAGFVPDAPTDPAGTAPRTTAPTRLRIPPIQVDTALEVLHLDVTGALAAPKDWAHAGWFAEGAVPGTAGPAVIAGHVDSTTGPAVFARLGQLRPRDLVEVQQGGAWVSFAVTAVERYRKDAFPTARVYGPTPDPQLRLITCSGDFNSAQRSYVDNTVVYAVAT